MIKKMLAVVCGLSIVWAMGIYTAEAGVRGSAGADEVVESIGDNGLVNWTSGIIQATGMGAPPDHITNPVQRLALARRAAVTVARRNLLEVVKGVRIDSETLLENYMIQSDDIQTSVSGYVRGAGIVKESNLIGGGVEVTVQVRLKGRFGEVLLGNAISPNFSPLTPSSAPQIAVDTAVEFTGLVVDARGIGVRPAITPRIIDENNREVYGSTNVGRDFAIKQGIAEYTKSLEAAQNNERVAPNPLIIKAIRAVGPSKTDMVIADADAGKIRSAIGQANFLEQCKVLIVID